MGHLNWKPSPLISINGVEVADYINYIAQTTSNFQDPDAIFNQAFTSLAFSYNPFTGSGGDLFVTGGHIYGFSADSYNYTFANGTTHTFFHAATTGVDFTDIQNGQDLFDAVDLPPTEDSVAPAVASSTTTAPSSTATAAKSTSTVITSLIGYPSPVVIHPDGYTSGYFLPNSTIAVLAMQGFIDATESDADAAPLQQAAVKAFLAAARKAGSTKLIVDLQANGGGDIFNGFDAFKQLFPTLDPFGASRLRATPEVNYLGTIFSAAGIYNETFNTVFQFQSSLDVNDHPFANWNAEDPPVTIYGDNFTQELRYNFTDSVSNSGGGLNVTGYLSNANAAPQLFKSEDIVLLYDGSCGSTCAVFSELMKSQGGVRSSKSLSFRPSPQKKKKNSNKAQLPSEAVPNSDRCKVSLALKEPKSTPSTTSQQRSKCYPKHSRFYKQRKSPLQPFHPSLSSLRLTCPQFPSASRSPSLKALVSISGTTCTMETRLKPHCNLCMKLRTVSCSIKRRIYIRFRAFGREWPTWRGGKARVSMVQRLRPMESFHMERMIRCPLVRERIVPFSNALSQACWSRSARHRFEWVYDFLFLIWLG